ncbi:MAG: hypothetical protein MJ231_03560, partial [bacterium]|nr:hypothetical protein [bacterium]
MSHNKQPHSGIVFGSDDIKNTDDIKQKNNKRNFWLAVILAYFASATIITWKSLSATSNKNAAAKRINDAKAEMTKFISLANDESIPTLKTCKSINKRLREILETKLLYKDADKELLSECGMPQSSNRFLLYGDPGNGKSFFSKNPSFANPGTYIVRYYVNPFRSEIN